MNPLERGAEQAPASIAFGDFSLDLVGRRLLDARGAPLELPPRLFDALLYFVEHRGELLDKDRLLAAFWPGQVVEENNLNKAVSALRHVLGDVGDGKRYLLTVPRRGFRFVAEVRSQAATAAQASAPGALPVPALAPATVAAAGLPLFAPIPAAAWTRRRAWVVSGAAGLAAASVPGWWLWRRRGETSPGARPRSPTTLAVLPFRPLVQQASDEALELGMADSLIARLGSAPGVIVRPVGSVRRYARADTDAQRAARELEVKWVLDGTIQQAGDRIRVTARLLDASDGSAAWHGSFDETFTNVFDVQDAISRRVAEVLVPRLAGEEPGALPAAGTGNARAYRLYLQARYHAQVYTPQSIRRAAALYEEAIAVDPDYAYAWAGLAEVLRRTLFSSDAPPAQTFQAIRAAADRALRIDPRLGEAVVHRAWATYFRDWDWPGAEEAFALAQRLSPSSVDAYSGYAHVLMTTGRTEQALLSFTRAREIDPLSPLMNTFEGAILTMNDRYADGVAAIRRALRIHPEFWIAHLFLGNVLSNAGHHEEALAALRQAVRHTSGSAWATAPLAYGLALAERSDEARAALRELEARSRSGYVPPAALAKVHVGLGETEPALDALDRAYAVRDMQLVYLQIDHRWTPLRREPRFVALAAKLRLDPAAPKFKSAF